MSVHQNVAVMAKDLMKEFPRSPRETLGGFVLAARLLDKCRATLNGTQGEYHYNCPLDRRFFDFSGIDENELQQFVSTGATDEEVGQWIVAHSKKPRLEIIKWNNQLRDLRLSDLPESTQEFLEEYMATYLPKNRPVYHWFDIFDIEEKRL